jgi:hypothetical protein
MSGSMFALVGASPVVTLPSTGVNTFALAPADQITVLANDLLGLRIEGPNTNTGLCGEYAAGGSWSYLLGAQPIVGVPTPFTPQPGVKLNVSATVETPTTPGGTGCDSTANANMTDACGQTQTLILRLFAAAVKASRV